MAVSPGAGEGDPGYPVRDPGDAWVVGPDGRERYWGRFGAAGLLLGDVDGEGVLLQLRVAWSHFGGTWGIPGGALHRGEDPVSGAIREAGEEAGIPADALCLRGTWLLDRGFWRYTTVVARATRPLEARATDRESVRIAWIPVADVSGLPLHPGFAAAWPSLRGMVS